MKNNEIIKIIMNTDGFSVCIHKSENGNYYVVDWKDGHYELEDVIKECEETIKAVKQFKEKYLI